MTRHHLQRRESIHERRHADARHSILHWRRGDPRGQLDGQRPFIQSGPGPDANIVFGGSGSKSHAYPYAGKQSIAEQPRIIITVADPTAHRPAGHLF